MVDMDSSGIPDTGSGHDGRSSGLSGTVFNVQGYSIHDGPGIRTTLFLKGCPLRCLWCCNPESQDQQPQLGVYPDLCIHCGSCEASCHLEAVQVDEGGPALDRSRCDRCGICAEVCVAGGIQQIGQGRSVTDLVEEAEKDRFFYQTSGGGVTLSGGEPTAQPAFAIALLRALRARGFHTAVETCGYTTWEILSAFSPYVDLWLYDLKQMDSLRHRELTGVPNELILENARRLAESGAEIIARAPVIPGCNDDETSMEGLVEFVASLGGVRELHLLPYHRLGVGKHAPIGKASPPAVVGHVPTAGLASVATLAARRGITVQVGG